MKYRVINTPLIIDEPDTTERFEKALKANEFRFLLYAGKRDEAYALYPGSWCDEPDELTFIDEETGLECRIERDREEGYLRGGVFFLGKEDKKMDIFSKNIQVYGGGLQPVSLVSATCYDYINIFLKWFISFHCGHDGDLRPFSLSSQMGEDITGSTYKDIEFVKAECRKLAKQLHEMINEQDNIEVKS